MGTPVRICRLGSFDVALLREVNAVFGDAFGEHREYTEAPPTDAYLSDLLKKEHIVVLAALVAGAVVGGLVAYELDKLERQRREIYIYDLAVSNAHRRRGVATGTINALKKIAASQGACVIFVQADLDDGPAIAFYSSLGTMRPAHHFDIEVGTIKSDDRACRSFQGRAAARRSKICPNEM